MDDYEDNKSKTCREGPKHFIRISKWDTNRNSLKSQMTLSIRSMILCSFVVNLPYYIPHGAFPVHSLIYPLYSFAQPYFPEFESCAYFSLFKLNIQFYFSRK